MINKRKNQNGFTLLEMIVAVGIITFSALGIFSAVARYSQQTQQERDNLVAAYLCQEGIEIVKNIRDTNWVSAAPSWKNGLTSCASGCEADYSSSLTSWSSPGNSLYIQSSTGLYKYIGSPQSGDVQTPYTRKITITEVGNDELDISVDVYWTGNTMTVKENIYNWK